MVVKSESGLTLLEVLVTIVLVAIGLLGCAALILNSTKQAGNSLWRSQASMMADEIGERIKANSYLPGVGIMPQPDYSVNCSTATAKSKPANCVAARNALTCNTVVAQKDMDLREVCLKISDVNSGGVPNGQLRIIRDATQLKTEGVFYRVIISWSVRTARTTDPQSFSYETLLRP